jgi:hypothetical protein
MIYINKILTIAEEVNNMPEVRMNVRLRELEMIQGEHDFLTFEEQVELNFICLKILTLKK